MQALPLILKPFSNGFRYPYYLSLGIKRASQLFTVLLVGCLHTAMAEIFQRSEEARLGYRRVLSPDKALSAPWG